MHRPAAHRRAIALAAAAILVALLGPPPLRGQAQPAPAPAPVLRGDTWQATQRAGHGRVTVAYYYPLEGFAYRDSSGKLSRRSSADPCRDHPQPQGVSTP
jgi:hypothetical protein